MMIARKMLCSLFVIMWVFTAGSLSAGTPFLSWESAEPDYTDSFIVGDTIGLMPFPDAVLFPHFLADPLYPRFKLLIADTRMASLEYREGEPVGDEKYFLNIGGKKSFFRLFPASDPELGIQGEIGFGFNSMVDKNRGTDFVGWDGVMHMAVALRPNDWLALQAGRYHLSSHRADEYLENSGSMYLSNYVRDSYGWAIMLLPTEHFRIYYKEDEAYFHRPASIRNYPRKVQAGMELDSTDFLGGDWTLAVDTVFYQENDWQFSYNVALVRHLGPEKRQGGVRIGAALYNGRIPIADFFEQREVYVSIGLWIDSPAVY